MKRLLKRFVSEDQGLESVEYAVLAFLIVVAVIVAVTALGNNLSAVYTSLSSHLTSATAGG